MENCDRAVEWYSAAAEQGKPRIPLRYYLSLML